MRTALLTLTICLLTLPVHAKYSGGTGEPNDPYQIATAADLIALGEDPNDYDKHFILTADIDLDPHLRDGKIFDKAVIAPSLEIPFTEVFDGKGHTIKNLKIAGKENLGLFGFVVSPARVSNLGLEAVGVIGASYVAGLVGRNGSLAEERDGGSISSCYSTGCVSGTHVVGGLVGVNHNGSINSSYSAASVSGTDGVGGLVGDNWGSIAASYSTGSVTGTYDVGGLVGDNWGSIAASYSTGPVNGTIPVGGLVGLNWGSVATSYSSGSVNGIANVGGLVGWNLDSIATSYSVGPVNGTQRVGGLVGGNWAEDLGHLRKGRITNSYSSGSVTGANDVGGLVGDNEWGSVSSSFWDIQTSGRTDSPAGMGRSTVEMQTAQTFLGTGWDFVDEWANGTEDIWWINEGKGYPRLSWEPNEPQSEPQPSVGPAGMVFVDIPPGTFEMGDHEGVGYPEERPVHTVTLTGFQMSKYETTNAQYAEYLNAAMADGLIRAVSGVVYASTDTSQLQPYIWPVGGPWCRISYDKDKGRFTVPTSERRPWFDHPVCSVSWYGAKAFCDYYGYRLPTEAEWEYAARGGYHDPYYQYPWGSNTIDCTRANYWNGSVYCNPSYEVATSPVGYYGPQGAYGLCDMSGNVYEWCQDWFGESFYSNSPASNPTGPTEGTKRVLRGGSYCSGALDHNLHPAEYCRVSNRGCHYPDRPCNADPYYRPETGFRVCR